MAEVHIRVLLVEDHEMVLTAISTALEAHQEIEIAGSAASVRAGADLIRRTPADVVVADMHLGDGLGSELAEVAATLDRPPPVLMITGLDDQEAVAKALTSGCAGFVSKAQGFDRLVEAIRAVAQGSAFYPAALMGAAFDAARNEPESDLSARELEVLRLLANARLVDEIAEELYLSPHTVRNHVKRILAKLGARSQLEAVVVAARLGLVEVV